MSIVIKNIPNDLSERLAEEYLDLKKRFSLNDWTPGQLQGGRFAEAVIRVYQHLLGETITPFGTDISSSEKTRIFNLVENHSSIDKHIRTKTVPITRLLLDFRNDRDGAHLGGFNANSVDTSFVMTSSTWVLCELIRVYGGYPMDEAQKIVEGLSVREYPVIIEKNGELFITRPGLKAEKEVLVLLYKVQEADEGFLFDKTKDKNRARFRKTLAKMVDQKLLAESGDKYFLLPAGISIVERENLLAFKT